MSDSNVRGTTNVGVSERCTQLVRDAGLMNNKCSSKGTDKVIEKDNQVTCTAEGCVDSHAQYMTNKYDTGTNTPAKNVGSSEESSAHPRLHDPRKMPAQNNFHLEVNQKITENEGNSISVTSVNLSGNNKCLKAQPSNDMRYPIIKVGDPMNNSVSTFNPYPSLNTQSQTSIEFHSEKSKS